MSNKKAFIKGDIGSRYQLFVQRGVFYCINLLEWIMLSLCEYLTHGSKQLLHFSSRLVIDLLRQLPEPVEFVGVLWRFIGPKNSHSRPLRGETRPSTHRKFWKSDWELSEQTLSNQNFSYLAFNAEENSKCQ